MIFDARNANGKGVALALSDRFTIKLTMSDGKTQSEWDSDPGTHPGTLKINAWQHVAVTVDGGPKIIAFLVDGVFNDGGAARQFGWGRFKPEMGDVNGLKQVKLAPAMAAGLARERGFKLNEQTAREESEQILGVWNVGRETSKGLPMIVSRLCQELTHSARPMRLSSSLNRGSGRRLSSSGSTLSRVKDPASGSEPFLSHSIACSFSPKPS